MCPPQLRCEEGGGEDPGVISEEEEEGEEEEDDEGVDIEEEIDEADPVVARRDEVAISPSFLCSPNYPPGGRAGAAGAELPPSSSCNCGGDNYNLEIERFDFFWVILFERNWANTPGKYFMAHGKLA